MAFALAGRVKETTAVTGASTLTVLGPATGFRAFASAIGNGNTCHYFITDNTDYEAGVGSVLVAAGATTTVSRESVLYSSNGGAQVVWSAGTKTVFAGLDGNASSIRGGLSVEHGPGLHPSGSTVVAGFSVVALSAATTLVAADRYRFFTCNGQFTVTLSSSGVLGAGWASRFANTGASVVTVTGASLTSQDFAPGSSADVLCIGTTFRRVGGHVSATQAQMEARSATDVVVTPARVKNHPGVAKVHILFDGVDANPNTGYNYNSLGDNGTGDYSPAFSTAFATTGYCTIGICDFVTGSTRNTFTVDIHTKAVGSLRILTTHHTTGQSDVETVELTCWGDQ
jgi:hypothetical protein